MARTDVIVLGAGIVGTSIALQLTKRNMSVALIERAGLGEQTSYGNSGVIEGATIMPPAFPNDFGALLRVAFKRASDANYHLGFLPWVAPWLLAFRAASQSDDFDLPMTHEQLAFHVGTVREVVTRNLKRFQDDGILMAERGRIRILRPDLLETEAETDY